MAETEIKTINGMTVCDIEARNAALNLSTFCQELDKTRIKVPSTAAIGQTIVVKTVDENGKPTEWETADLSSSEGGVATELKTVLLEKDTYPFAVEDGDTLHTWFSTEPLSLTVGEAYLVEWDGVVWECVAQDMSETTESDGTVVLGNLELLGGAGNGEPFIVVSDPSAGTGMIDPTPIYTRTETVIDAVEGTILDGVYTTEGDAVYLFDPEDGSNQLYTILAGEDGVDTYYLVTFATEVTHTVTIYQKDEVATQSYVKSYVEEYISSALEGDY